MFNREELPVPPIALEMERPAMTSPVSPKRDDRSVKIARDLVVKAKVIAEVKGISIAEYLSEILRPHIQKDWPKAIASITSLDSTDK